MGMKSFFSSFFWRTKFVLHKRYGTKDLSSRRIRVVPSMRKCCAHGQIIKKATTKRLSPSGWTFFSAAFENLKFRTEPLLMRTPRYDVSSKRAQNCPILSRRRDIGAQRKITGNGVSIYRYTSPELTRREPKTPTRQTATSAIIDNNDNTWRLTYNNCDLGNLIYQTLTANGVSFFFNGYNTSDAQMVLQPLSLRCQQSSISSLPSSDRRSTCTTDNTWSLGQLSAMQSCM